MRKGIQEDMSTELKKVQKKFADIFKIIVLLPLSCCGGHGGGGGNEFIPLSQIPYRVETVVAGAAFPVGIAFLPDGRLIYLELTTGWVRVMEGDKPADGAFASIEISPAEEPQVFGLAVDPRYTENNFIYISHISAQTGSTVVTRIRVRSDGDGKSQVIISGLPGGGHSGGKMVFDKDENLFVSTGDGGIPASSQDMDSVAGKILRITRDGEIPRGNPNPESAIFAAGFRNVFGLAIRDGKLFATDNGPDCNDEINLVRKGKNYGWREGQPCNDTDPQFEKPLFTINPPVGITDLEFYQGDSFPELDGDLLVGDYVSGSIRRIVLDGSGENIDAEEMLVTGTRDGVLDIASGLDGAIYYSTISSINRVVRN